MRLPLIIASILCSVIYSSPSFAGPLKKPVNSRKLGLSIKVEGDGWGNVRKDVIESVLYSVADELMSRLPKKLEVPIVVRHTDGNPVALYERGGGGEYRVALHAKDENWHLYTYEFAHELCHILSNYEENARPGANRYNQWFEETLCETASLYTLKSLAATWQELPPLPDWGNEIERLNRFYDLLIAEGHRELPPHTPLADWLTSNEKHLQQNPYLREKNEMVANLLLPLFQRNPENWSSLAYLNQDAGNGCNSLQDYLRSWYQNAPAEHKTFIADVLALFDMREVIVAAIPTEGMRVAAADTAALSGAARPK